MHTSRKLQRLLRLAAGLVLACAGALAQPNAALASDCGADGMRVCLVTERLQPCDHDLVPAAGFCVHPNCGREGQRGCGPTERMIIDPVLRAPVPQMCDFNLIWTALDNRCYHPACGRNRDMPCDPMTRVPSCDVNLTDLAGLCLHDSCGGAGQPPCEVSFHHALGGCDVDLIERNGVCQRPGVSPPPAPPRQVIAPPVRPGAAAPLPHSDAPPTVKAPLPKSTKVPQ